MARGEYQSFQLLVAAGDKDVRAVRVTAGPVVFAEAAKGAPEIQVNLSLVGYVLSHADDRRPWGKATKVGWWPDPLLPNRHFDVAAGQTQPVWVTLFAPAGAPPGMYAGKLDVMVGNRQVAQSRYQ